MTCGALGIKSRTSCWGSYFNSIYVASINYSIYWESSQSCICSPSSPVAGCFGSSTYRCCFLSHHTFHVFFFLLFLLLSFSLPQHLFFLQLILYLLQLQFCFLQPLLFSLPLLRYLHPFLPLFFHCLWFLCNKRIYFHFSALLFLWTINNLPLSLFLDGITTFFYYLFRNSRCLWISI